MTPDHLFRCFFCWENLQLKHVETRVLTIKHGWCFPADFPLKFNQHVIRIQDSRKWFEHVSKLGIAIPSKNSMVSNCWLVSFGDFLNDGQFCGIIHQAWWCHQNSRLISVYHHFAIWVWVNTYRYIFSGMNIHLPAILGFTRYQGFDPSPYFAYPIYQYLSIPHWPSHLQIPPFHPKSRDSRSQIALCRVLGQRFQQDGAGDEIRLTRQAPKKCSAGRHSDLGFLSKLYKLGIGNYSFGSCDRCDCCPGTSFSKPHGIEGLWGTQTPGVWSNWWRMAVIGSVRAHWFC